MTKEQIFADFFERNSHGDKSIMKAMLDILLQGVDDRHCKQVIKNGYSIAIQM